ncbi:hypothetical protein MIR68_010819 [Amoeboaphelidium protococcarum]|nr:hypothetical protein MIR68_010819 [Amoeboaphelidium protococcarum]
MLSIGRRIISVNSLRIQKYPLASGSRLQLNALGQRSFTTRPVIGPSSMPVYHRQPQYKSIVLTKQWIKKYSTNQLAPQSSNNNQSAKKSLWTKIKEEALHYWNGTKLLAKEMKISTLLLMKQSRGHKLSRREHRQLLRTSRDMVKLIPFSIFVLVPFTELLLPFVLRIFPNMLPSTYEHDKGGVKDEGIRKQTWTEKVKLAKMLRQSINKDLETVDNAGSAQEFAKFFKKYRSSGERASTEEILAMCKKISDDITIDNLSRPQLITLARFVNLNPTSNTVSALTSFATDNMLRAALRRRMRQIKSDDEMIHAEGLDSLTIYELVQACHARGIKTVGVDPDRLRFELRQWMDLHLVHKIPFTLVLLSRAYIMSERAVIKETTTEVRPDVITVLEEAVGDGGTTLSEREQLEALQQTLNSLPPKILAETELKLQEDEIDREASKKDRKAAASAAAEVARQAMEEAAQQVASAGSNTAAAASEEPQLSADDLERDFTKRKLEYIDAEQKLIEEEEKEFSEHPELIPDDDDSQSDDLSSSEKELRHSLDSDKASSIQSRDELMDNNQQLIDDNIAIDAQKYRDTKSVDSVSGDKSGDGSSLNKK